MLISSLLRTNFAKVSEKKKDYLGRSISGVTKRVHKPPLPPRPKETSFMSLFRAAASQASSTCQPTRLPDLWQKEDKRRTKTKERKYKARVDS